MKPVAWMYEVNDTFILFSANKPPEDAYDEGSLVPLYTAPRELSDEEYADACLSYRHDFGLMTKEEQKSLMFQAKEWHRALKKASEK